MAQLPPKIPNMAPNWPDFSSHQKIPSLTSMTPNNVATTNSNANNSNNSHQNQSWVDEFFDFSSSRRGAHRRSVSDSITFIETPMLEDCRGNSGAVPPRSGGDNNEFDRFDDDQFMSMFTDDISGNPMPPTISSSNPSSPSDHNSINDDKETTLLQPTEKLNKKEVELQKQVKNESDEVESQDELDTQAPNNTNNNNNAPSSADKITDPKRVKRILANRQSAQRSRVRKLQYISELERSVTSLQAEVSVLSPRVAYLDHQRLLLNVDNSALKQRIAALQQDKLFKDAHQEALRKEIERLRQVYHHQSLKKMENIAAGPPSPSPSPSPSAKLNTESGAKTEKEKLIDV